MKKKFRIKNIKVGSSKFSNYQQYGILCIKSLGYGILTTNQLEAIRRCILRKIKRKGII
jgi:ribosomal protein L16/L10AE